MATRKKTTRGGGPPSGDRLLAKKSGEATAAVRGVFPGCGPVVVFRKSGGGFGFRLDVDVSSGDRAKLDEAYRAVTRVLGERRGRPVGRRTVQTKLLLPTETYAALKASARSSKKTMSGLAAEAIKRLALGGEEPPASSRAAGPPHRGGPWRPRAGNLDDVFVYLRETPPLLRQLAAGLADADVRWKPRPEEFSFVENTCHLRDIEREGFAVRIERLLSETGPHLADLDGDLLARQRRYNEQDPAAALAEFEQARSATVRRLSGLSGDQLGRSGHLEGVGPISIAGLAMALRDHDAEHRKAILNLRDRLLQSPSSDRESAAILEAVGKFVDAFGSGDLDGVMAIYTEDLVKVRHGAGVESRSDLARRLAGTFARFDCRLEVDNEEVIPSGQLGFVRGRFRVTLTPKEGGPPQMTDRRFFEIWRKEQGRWLVARTMDSPV